MAANEIIELLSNGGWGVAALAILAVVRLYLDAKAKDKLVFQLLDKQAEILTALRGEKPKPPKALGD